MSPDESDPLTAFIGNPYLTCMDMDSDELEAWQEELEQVRREEQAVGESHEGD